MKRHCTEALGQTARWGRGRIASKAQIEKGRSLHAQGESVRSICATTGISKPQVGRILRPAAQLVRVMAVGVSARSLRWRRCVLQRQRGREARRLGR